jgi:hypothetical protein
VKPSLKNSVQLDSAGRECNLMLRLCHPRKLCTRCDLNKHALQSDTVQSLVGGKLCNLEIFSMQVATIRQSEAVVRLLSLGINS